MLRNRSYRQVEFDLPLTKLLDGSTSAGIRKLGEREVVFVSSRPSANRGALTEADGRRIANAAELAAKVGLPFVLILSTSGAEINDGVPALHGWGMAARAIAHCSGRVPILTGLVGPAVSGPTLLLGLSDFVVVTSDAFAFLSGPSMVQSFTGVAMSQAELGGANVLMARSGVAYEEASDADEVLATIADLLDFLPNSTDELPPRHEAFESVDEEREALDHIIPASPTSSYDVRDIVKELVDFGEFMELRRLWAPHLVTGLARIAGRTVGILANQPMIMAGTLDIPAAQKGGRFVRFCDAFNIPLITLEDTPGFLPGKDVEWRGMIRHGAELAFSYAACGVPRICVITRKAYGGAYIVMDSKGMGNDLTLAWPSAEIAVMGAEGAVQILHRRSTPEEQIELKEAYEQEYLTPWVAAERGYVDMVIEPRHTRSTIAKSLDLILTKRERIRAAKHANSPL
jgi:acetyl-CoA carboxylase carboxyltransferase component